MAEKAEKATESVVSYVITIKNEISKKSGGASTASATSAPSVSSSGNGGVAKTVHGESADGFSLSKKQMMNIGITAVKRIGNRVSSVIIDNHVGLADGHTTLQAKLNYNKQVANRILSIGLPIIVGTVTGNPMVVAAGIGSAVSWGVDIAVAQDRINIQRSVENIGIGMANTRAGAGGYRNN